MGPKEWEDRNNSKAEGKVKTNVIGLEEHQLLATAHAFCRGGAQKGPLTEPLQNRIRQVAGTVM